MPVIKVYLVSSAAFYNEGRPVVSPVAHPRRGPAHRGRHRQAAAGAAAEAPRLYRPHFRYVSTPDIRRLTDAMSQERSPYLFNLSRSAWAILLRFRTDKGETYKKCRQA